MIRCDENLIDNQRKLFKKIQNIFTLFENENYLTELKYRMIINQLDDDLANYHLTEKQFDALIKTVKEFGEKYINIINIELRENETFETTKEIYKMDLNTSYEEYENFPFYLETVVFSEKGNWGILLSSDFFSILCGEKEFIKIYKKNYPEWKKELEIFKKNFFDPIFFNLENIKKLFNYIIENESDLTLEEKHFLGKVDN